MRAICASGSLGFFLRHLRLLFVPDQLHQPALRGVERNYGCAFFSPAQQILPGRKVEFALRLFTAVALETVFLEHRANFALEQRDAFGHPRSVIRRQRVRTK
jgi:hypothetical protein